MGLSNAERQARWRAKRDAEIKRLHKAASSSQDLAEARARIKELEVEAMHLRLAAHKGVMPFETYSKVMKCLHPDSKPSDGQRQEAYKLFSQWKQVGEKARRRTR